MAKGYPADAHDAGFVAVEWKRGFPAAAHAGFVAAEWKRGFPADAHDAGSVAVGWKKVCQLMLMMLGSWRWSGKRVTS